MYRSPIAERILAEHLLNHGAVSFLTEQPMRLKSGLITPIYVDNRLLCSYPASWRDIIETLISTIDRLHLEFDVIAGMEGAGVSHAAALAYRLGKPHVFIRRSPKTWGNHSCIEGANIKGQRVLIIEDHLSTGISLLSAIDAVREEGGIVSDALAITSFGIPETLKLLDEKHVECHEAVDFSNVLTVAQELNMITAEQREKLADWLAHPWSWAARHGLVANAIEN